MSEQQEVLASEFAVIGGLLIEPSRFSEIDLSPADFFVRTNALIFEAISDMIRDGREVDAVTVADFLDAQPNRKGDGWLNRTVGMANNTPSAANIRAYAGIVREESVRRQAVAVAENLRNDLQNGMEAVDKAIRDLMLLASPRHSFECTTRQAVTVAIDAIEKAWNAKGALTGITTGVASLDKSLGGLHRSDLIVVGARPSVGKTAFMLNLADNSDCSVGVISGEQGREQVGLRLIAKNGRLNAHGLRIGRVSDEEWPKVSNAVMRLADKRIFINDKPHPSIDDVMRQARKWKFQYDIKAVYIDYLQRIRAPSTMVRAPRHEQVGYVALCMKELARELDIPVVALAQVNRSVEERVNKRPNMGDLKDSGSIEQEADLILLLYRDDVYNEDSADRGIMEVNVAKNRHGPTGNIRCAWDAESMTVNDLYGVIS
jgi:replicative DNA helicase